MNFQAQVEKEVGEIARVVNRAMGQAAIAGQDIGIGMMRIDTGRMRSGTEITLNTPTSSRLPEPSRPKGHAKGIDIFSGQRAAAVAAGHYIANKFDVQNGGRYLYINNTISYEPQWDEIDMYTNVIESTVAAKLSGMVK